MRSGAHCQIAHLLAITSSCATSATQSELGQVNVRAVRTLSTLNSRVQPGRLPNSTSANAYIVRLELK